MGLMRRNRDGGGGRAKVVEKGRRAANARLSILPNLLDDCIKPHPLFVRKANVWE